MRRLAAVAAVAAGRFKRSFRPMMDGGTIDLDNLQLQCVLIFGKLGSGE